MIQNPDLICGLIRQTTTFLAKGKFPTTTVTHLGRRVRQVGGDYHEVPWLCRPRVSVLPLPRRVRNSDRRGCSSLQSPLTDARRETIPDTILQWAKRTCHHASRNSLHSVVSQDNDRDHKSENHLRLWQLIDVWSGEIWIKDSTDAGSRGGNIRLVCTVWEDMLAGLVSQYTQTNKRSRQTQSANHVTRLQIPTVTCPHCEQIVTLPLTKTPVLRSSRVTQDRNHGQRQHHVV